MKLPVFRDLQETNRSFLLRDVRSMPSAQSKEARKLGSNFLAAVLGEVRPGVNLCGSGDLDAHFSAEYLKAAAESKSKLSYDEWFASQDPVRDDADCDPRLGTSTFVVYEKREVRGTFVLYNVELLRDESSPQRRVVGAMAMPACMPLARASIEDTWALIMKTVLVQDLLGDDGTAVDVKEWRFPQRKDHRWQGNGKSLSGLNADRLVAKVAEGMDLNFEGSVPVKVRRRDRIK